MMGLTFRRRRGGGHVCFVSHHLTATVFGIAAPLQWGKGVLGSRTGERQFPELRMVSLHLHRVVWVLHGTYTCIYVHIYIQYLATHNIYIHIQCIYIYMYM